MVRWPVAGASRHQRNAVSTGPSNDVEDGLVVSGGLGLALPSAPAKRSRLLLDVFDDCPYGGCKLSPRVRAIIREMNESVLALKFFKTGGIGRSESCEKMEYSMLP